MFPRDVYICSLVLDGNFSGSHLKQRCPEDDVWLTGGDGMMVKRMRYAEHLAIAIEIKEVNTMYINASYVNIDICSLQPVLIKKLMHIRIWSKQGQM